MALVKVLLKKMHIRMKINGETFNSEIVNVAIFLTTFNIINSFYAAFCVIKKILF